MPKKSYMKCLSELIIIQQYLRLKATASLFMTLK